ncbi:hypothetical protein [Natronomonas sp.]|uniref:hypothetical protein n=1 Tax=Natronomonas sp. TaxID=2184060 RepID=UPI0026098265|nr:hypothetical protein [Natronomonas sp.]
MTDGVRQEVREYLRRNPDATTGEVLGALSLSPEYRETIASIRGEPVTEPDGNTPEQPTSNLSDENNQNENTGDGSRVETGSGLAGDLDKRDKSSNPSFDSTDYEGGSMAASAFMGGSDSPHASDEDPTPATTSTPTEANYERAVSALPVGQLDALTPDDRRRAARKRGLEWPSTDAAREELFETLADVLRHEDDRVIDAPTSLGKSHTVAATRGVRARTSPADGPSSISPRRGRPATRPPRRLVPKAASTSF